MESQNEEHAGAGAAAARLLHAQTHVWNHILSFISSMSLKSAIELNIPDIIHKHGKPMPLPLLISSLQIHPSKSPNIHRLMRLLTHTGFFSLQKLPETDPVEEGYVLTDASTLLLKDHPFTLAPFLLAHLDPILTKPWDQLASWFHNDDPTPFEATHGEVFWEYAWREPRLYNHFNGYLISDSRLVSRVVVEQCKEVFQGLGSLVDVGGGTGTMAKAIAEVFPEMECTVFDSSYVIGGMKGSGNLKFVEGDMFQSIPPADVILLKWVLHDWNDEESREILKKCKEAITKKGKKGKVIIIDMSIEKEKGDYESLETQLLFDLLMMVVVSGKQRTKKEWTELIFSAGFSSCKITPVLGLRSLIEVYP